MQTRHGFALIEGQTATVDEIANVELDLAVVLPDRYKAFMMQFGGGTFGFVELFPIATTPVGHEDLGTVNNREFPDGRFLAVAPVGTGDHWGFPVIEGRCHDSVAADFRNFIAKHGLKSSADRALEGRN